MPPRRSPRLHLRVAIDARLVSGESGGVESVITGLADGLSGLEGPEEYLFVVWPGHGDWLAPYVSGSARLATVDFEPEHRPSRAERGFLRGEARARHMLGLGPRVPDPDAHQPRRDPRVEALGPDLVHMIRQRGFVTDTPSIYHPHDLQHAHLPEFFDPREIKFRERVYRRLSTQAEMVAVASEWTRLDVVTHFRLPPEKVRVVPLAPPLAAAQAPSEAERRSVRSRLSLPAEYLLYPAQTWPHKNHLRLLEAMAVLRDAEGVDVHLVATGTRNDYSPVIDAAVNRLGLEDRVHWAGFVPATDLRAIYVEARGVIIPTLFEAASAPLWEAFLAGTPAACSSVTSLPDQAGDAALIFDPLSVDGIAGAMARLWTDDDLRVRLAIAGRLRVAEYTWERSARIFRAHYRRIATGTLTEEDRDLVGAAA